MAWGCFAFFSERAFLVTVAVAFVADSFAVFGVFISGRESQESHDHDAFRAATVDMIVSLALRIVLLPVLSFFAFKLYDITAARSPLRQFERQQEQIDAEAPAAGTNGTTIAPTNGHSTCANGNDLATPLRQAGDQADDSASTCAASGAASSSTHPPASAAPTASTSPSSSSLGSSMLDAQRDHAVLMKQADKRKGVVMAVTFAIVTAMSMHNGLKCVGFHYDPKIKALQGALFGVVMFFINLEYFLLREYIGKVTEEKGEMIPHVHMHPLFFSIGLKCHVCDLCHESMKGPHYITYRCRTCDFDLCPRCHRKKDDPNARGFGTRAVRQDGDQLTTWSYFKRILQLTLEFGHVTTMAIVCLIGTQSMQIWAPHVSGKIFDSLIKYTKDPSGGRGEFEGVMLLYLLVSVLEGAFSGLKALAQELVLRQLACSVRIKLFRSVIRMDISFFDTMHTGQITSRLTNDASQMVQPLNTLLNDLVANLMLLIGGMAMAFRTSWKLSMLALTVVPPITYIYRQYAKFGRQVNRSIYCAYGEASSVATEAIHNIRTVRGFSTEQHEMEKYEDSIGTALVHGKRSAYVGASVSAFSTYLNLGTAVLILWYGGTQVCDSMGSAMSIGNLITYQLYWNMMNTAFISLGNVFNDLIRSSSAAERVISLIDARPEVDPDSGEVVDRQTTVGQMELRSVEFRYKTRPENLVLKGVDLSMTPGTVTALVGKSGGGKSTLVHLLMRFYEPTQGSLLLDGRDMRDLSSRSVRAMCGFVAQDTQLFAKSIEENLAYGLGRPHTKEEVIEACKAANAHEFIMDTEEQYETRVGERGMLLSGGQRQRLAIARCFLRKPRLLFLDEATSALDAENEALVQQALDTLIEQSGCTVVLIAHRLCTVINANQIAVVHKGSIIERGGHDELVKLGGIYAKLVERQMARDASTMVEEKKTSGATESKGAAGGGKGMQNEIDQLIEEMEDTGALGD